MREILFRGKRIDNGEWVYGHFYETRGNGKNVFRIYEGLNHKHHTIIPETIGRYTGLIDKNGTKSFEGDIVRHHNGCFGNAVEKGKVYWDERSCGWRRTSNGAFHHGIVGTYKMSPECVYEVIGNIHDNPELIGGKGEGDV